MGGPENVQRDEDFEKEGPRQREGKGMGSSGDDDQVKKNIRKIKSEIEDKARKALG